MASNALNKHEILRFEDWNSNYFKNTIQYFYLFIYNFEKTCIVETLVIVFNSLSYSFWMQNWSLSAITKIIHLRNKYTAGIFY